MVDARWLPDRHLGVTATLAHVDELVRRVGELLFDYQTQCSDVVRLREVSDGQLRHLARLVPLEGCGRIAWVSVLVRGLR